MTLAILLYLAGIPATGAFFATINETRRQRETNIRTLADEEAVRLGRQPAPARPRLPVWVVPSIIGALAILWPISALAVVGTLLAERYLRR